MGDDTRRSRGFSLLELLIALACTAILSGAVFTLLVGSAEAVRSEWSVASARRVAAASVAAVSLDMARAGAGIEGSTWVLHRGERIPVAASSAAPGTVRLVLARSAALEVLARPGPGRYVVATSSPLRSGDLVAAIGQESRPPGAPAPLGFVMSIARLPNGHEVSLGWDSTEAARVVEWGPPRALLGVVLREYATRPVAGRLQLDRRDNGGPRQPLADGLDAFTVRWLIDTSGDQRIDQEHERFDGSARLCAVRVAASSAPASSGRGAGGRVTAPIEAVRWVSFARC